MKGCTYICMYIYKCIVGSDEAIVYSTKEFMCIPSI